MSVQLESGWEHYKNLYSIMYQRTQNVLALQTLLQQLKKITDSYAQEIEKISENFHKEISKETNEQDILVFYYQFISNFLLKTAQNQKTLAKNISSEIIDPYELFVQNFRQTNRNIAREGKTYLTDLEDKRYSQQKQQEQYYKLSKTAEKSGELIEKTISLMEKGMKTQQDLQKISDKSVKSKILAQESEIEYKNRVEDCNKSWGNFQENFGKLFTNFDYNDESRISFTKQTITNLSKYMIELNSQESGQNLIQQQKLQEYEDRYSKEKKMSCVKILQSQIPQGQLFLEKHSEQFVSYQANMQQEYQKFQEDFVIIGEVITEKEKIKIDQIIDDIVNEDSEFLQVFENHRHRVNSHYSSRRNSDEEIPVQKLSQSVNSNNNEESKEDKDSQKKSASTENLEDSTNSNKENKDDNPIAFFNHIFRISQGRFYFLDTLWTRIHDKKQYHFSCHDDKFFQLAEVMKIILQKNKGPDFKPEDFFSVLQISSRIIKQGVKNKEKDFLIEKEFLSQLLNKEPIFKDEKNWTQLYEYVSKKKVEEKIKRHQILKAKQNDDGFIKGGVIKGFSIVTKGIGFGLQALGFGHQKKEEMKINETEQNEINYYMLSDINNLMLNLQLSSEFSSKLIINIAQDRQIGVQQIQNLLEKQEDQKNSELRRFYYSYKRKKEKNEIKYQNLEQNKRYKQIYAIKLCLQFLDASDKPWNLMLVSRDFKKQLEKKIFKMYLLRDEKNNQFLTKNRIKINSAWLKTDIFEIDYQKLKKEMIKVQQSQEKQARIEEIIDLDVQRSLHIHKNEISSEILESLLKTFAHSNKVISYCQGMNYIAGFLYLTIQDEAETYKQFHIIMNLYFQDLFTNQFKRLRIMFYQLTRCLSIFLPKLSEHFKYEGIDPEYYATGWFITIFTSVFQYAMKSHFLQIIWDIFIIEGWKGFFKCVLWILKKHQQQLLDMQFDELLHFLGEIIKSEMFSLNAEQLKEKKIIENIDTVKQEILEFDITTRFLLKLEKQYECFQLSIKGLINDKSQDNTPKNQSSQQ